MKNIGSFPILPMPVQTGKIVMVLIAQICYGKSVSTDSQASTNDHKAERTNRDNVKGYTGRG